ncbi:hypothetical protein PR003_g16454 [Phytophthora rubi]|uniref:Uncharacterized protein n=1 Tax=Phytophthora rubi TaxID=129364 RepID=A0A6A3L4S9_9STRA|nr:hypothetical protein PR001_g15243 [Phytophthora rubi]KAE9325553.1 hypothetical protein PR003_g16454 [Phytophthora rubi]
MGRGVPLDYKKRQGSDQASDQVANSDDSSADQVADEQVCCHKSGDLRAEDVEAKMVVLPEVMSAMEEMTINDIHAGDPTINTAEQIDHLQLIWRNQHLTIDNGQTLPPAARGIACDVNESVSNGGDKILGAIAASITPQSEEDWTLTAIAPEKESQHEIQVPIQTVRLDEELWVASFDGSACVKRDGGAYSAILWKLPEWDVVRARSGYAKGLTINEAEYHGLFLCMDLLEGEDQQRLVICGGSNLVIRQVRGEIECKAPGLTLLRQKALDRLRVWPDHELVHVKRDWNSSSESMARVALRRQGGIVVEDEGHQPDPVTLNRLGEILSMETDLR